MKSYLIDPMQLVSTSRGLIRADKLHPDLEIKSLVGNQTILEVNKVEKIVKEVVFKNGITTSLDLQSSVQTKDGLIPVSKMKSEDYVNFCFFNYFISEQETKINWKDKKMAIPIRIPKVLTLDFAYWLGIVSAQSKSSVNHRHIQVELKKDGPLKEIFIKLTKKIFNLTVDEVKEGERIFLQINSSNLVQFLQHNVGRRLMMFRKVPVFIQEADIQYQMAYVRGLSLKGHQDEGKTAIYSGSSKSISSFVASFLTNIGYGVYRKIKSLEKTKVYVVYISFCHRESVRIDSEFTKGINPFNSELEYNPEFKQNYLIPINSILNKLDKSKETILSLKKEMKWEINLLKEEKKLAIIRYKKANKILKADNLKKYENELCEVISSFDSQIFEVENLYKSKINSNKKTNIPGYKTIMKAKERGQEYIKAEAFKDNLVLDNIEYLIKVKEVKLIKKEMIEIVTTSDTGIIIEGLIVQ